MKENVNCVTNTYTDVNATDLLQEIKRFRRHAKSFSDITGEDVSQFGSWEMLQWIVKWTLIECLPNLTILLCIFLTIGVSVASCKRSFSKLKLIKTFLRSTMTQKRLTNLATLSIKKKAAENLDDDKILSDFAASKAKKM